MKVMKLKSDALSCAIFEELYMWLVC